MQAKFSLTEGSIPRALFAFSLPILFGNVLEPVNGSVNAIWVGRYLGAAAFAAVGNSNVVMFLLFGVMFGFSMASTVMVAQCVGAKNIAEAKRVVGTSAVFFLGISLGMSVVGSVLTHLLLAWLATPPTCCRRRWPTCGSYFWLCRSWVVCFSSWRFYAVRAIRGLHSFIYRCRWDSIFF